MIEDGITYNRLQYFKYGNPGSRLLLQDNAYLLIIINNNIFVHGQLVHNKTFQEYINLNNNINNLINNPILNDPNHVIQSTHWNNLQSQNMNGRTLIDNNQSNQTSWGRMYDRESSSNNNDQHNIKCNNVKDNLQNFLANIKSFNKDYLFNVDNLRIMVGHCPQFMGNKMDNSSTINSTFTNITSENNIYEKLSGSVRTNIQDINTNLIFGIGMECRKNGGDDNLRGDDDNERYIYKLDVGSMRGFDHVSSINTFPNYLSGFNYEYLPRTPQVLEILNNEISIIRSKIRNTRIHQPRWSLESLINTGTYPNYQPQYGKVLPILPEPNVYIPPEIPPPEIQMQIPPPPLIQHGVFPVDSDLKQSLLKHNNMYTKKYLKYKKKYLELQNHVISNE
jgi:hypothetical protein